MRLKQVVFFSILTVSFFISVELLSSILSLRQKDALVTSVRLSLEKEKKEHEQLVHRLEQSKKNQFIEEEARNKLFLARNGEELVVIPSPSVIFVSKKRENAKDLRPNWQQWWELFF